MLSKDCRSLATFLSLACEGVVLPNPAALKVACRMAADLEQQALQLEAAQVPRRQRLNMEHLRTGNVVMLGVVPRIEATQP
jgi:hypothetical protein